MPQGDGSGPGRSSSGRGQGQGQGQGQGGGAGLGTGVSCICINCGEKVTHQRGVPCFEIQCPKCGSMLTRGRTQNPKML